MTFLELSPHMEFGIPEIDNQHKTLINKVNALISMGSRAFSKIEIEKALEVLDKFASEHFILEESLQMESKYPKYQQHKKLHAGFVFDFNLMRKEFAEKGTSHKFTYHIIIFIADWIINHVGISDSEFARYYKEYAYKEYLNNKKKFININANKY